ncbi:hypothetical protein BLNAU_3651 [Blattamonas nauphoetae]|uniref:Uncharacterized protein n=1 Tax=Blattamonas nauphoetae TaxID=2049346 RepID=A0ABQ9YCS3_9EUKA|nr:hypothetical protein BLNAU_3651 [Blattamonas nauphoetae]
MSSTPSNKQKKKDHVREEQDLQMKKRQMEREQREQEKEDLKKKQNEKLPYHTPTKYRYERMEQKYKQEEEALLDKVKKQKKKENSIDFKAIRDHEQTTNTRDQETTKKSFTQNETPKKLDIPQTQAMRRVLEEEKRQKLSQKEKKQELEDKRRKQQLYSEKLRSSYTPRSLPPVDNQLTSSTKQKPRTLPHFEQRTPITPSLDNLSPPKMTPPVSSSLMRREKQLIELERSKEERLTSETPEEQLIHRLRNLIGAISLEEQSLKRSKQTKKGVQAILETQLDENDAEYDAVERALQDLSDLHGLDAETLD